MGRQAPEIPPQLSEEPRKFLPQEVASLERTTRRRYRVPTESRWLLHSERRGRRDSWQQRQDVTETSQEESEESADVFTINQQKY